MTTALLVGNSLAYLHTLAGVNMDPSGPGPLPPSGIPCDRCHLGHASKNVGANPPLNDRRLAPARGVSWAKEVAIERAQAKPQATLSIHGPTVPERQWIKSLAQW